MIHLATFLSWLLPLPAFPLQRMRTALGEPYRGPDDALANCGKEGANG